MGSKVVRLYSGPDNESHFDEIEIPLQDKKEIGGQPLGKGVAFKQWDLVKATGVYISEIAGPYKHGWHNAPRRQFLFTIQGEWEIEIGDGTRRRFRPGDTLLAEDTVGRGHISRNVNGQPRRVIIVTLD